MSEKVTASKLTLGKSILKTNIRKCFQYEVILLSKPIKGVLQGRGETMCKLQKCGGKNPSKKDFTRGLNPFVKHE